MREHDVDTPIRGRRCAAVAMRQRSGLRWARASAIGRLRRVRRWVSVGIVAAAVTAGCSEDSSSTTSAVTTALAPLGTTAASAGPATTDAPTSLAAATADASTSLASAPPSPTPTAPVSVSSPATLPPTTSSTSTTTTSTTSPPTTTTLLTAGATVLVANATDVPGAAGRLTESLRARGFTVVQPTNAAGNEEYLDVSKVYFLPPGDAVARSIAVLMGLTAAPLPVPAPIVGANVGLGDATVLVMIGADLAGKPFPGS